MGTIADTLRRRRLALAASTLLACVATFLLAHADAAALVTAVPAALLGLLALAPSHTPDRVVGAAPVVPEAERATRLASLDELKARLEQLRAASSRVGHDFGVVYMEIDETIAGDSQAHAELAGERLRAATRGSDTPAQVGAAAYAVTLALSERSNGELFAAGARLVNAVSRESEDGPALSVSVGVALYDGAESVDDLIDRARDVLGRGDSAGHVGLSYSRRFARRRPRPEGPEDRRPGGAES